MKAKSKKERYKKDIRGKTSYKESTYNDPLKASSGYQSGKKAKAKKK